MLEFRAGLRSCMFLIKVVQMFDYSAGLLKRPTNFSMRSDANRVLQLALGSHEAKKERCSRSLDAISISNYLYGHPPVG